ncbi:unnamed protein product, partial [marine sediment metagenome]
GKYEKAINEFVDVIGDEPDNGEAYRKMTVIPFLLLQLQSSMYCHTYPLEW